MTFVVVLKIPAKRVKEKDVGKRKEKEERGIESRSTFNHRKKDYETGLTRQKVF